MEQSKKTIDGPTALIIYCISAVFGIALGAWLCYATLYAQGPQLSTDMTVSLSTINDSIAQRSNIVDVREKLKLRGVTSTLPEFSTWKEPEYVLVLPARTGLFGTGGRVIVYIQVDQEGQVRSGDVDIQPVGYL